MSGRLTLGFLAPMPSELQPLRDRLTLTSEHDGLDATHVGTHGDHAVVALITGIGMARAEARVQHLLATHAIDHVVVIGIAGGIGEHLSIGDVVVPAVVVDQRDGRELVPTGIGGIGAIEPAGRLLSGDALVKDPDVLATMRATGAYAIDMETAAIGRVCEDEGVAWSVFRGISDDAFDPQVDERILALTHPDGSPNVDAITRFVEDDPAHVQLLARLGEDLAASTSAAVDAALAATATL